MHNLPSGWRIAAIQDIADIIRGSSPRPKSDPRFYGGSIPRLMGADVSRDGKYVTPRIDFLTEEGAKLSRPMPAGTLIIVCSGEVGVPSFLAVDACIHDGFLALKNVSPGVDLNYIYYILWKLKHRLDASATHGGVFTNLTTTILKEFEIPLPPLAEQRKIAAILGAWDEAISAAERLIAALRKRKRGLMQRLLTGQVRFPAFAGRAWQEHELRDCVDPVSRMAKVESGQDYNLIGVRWYLEGAHIHDTVSGYEMVTQALSRVHENDIVYNKMWVTKAAFAIAKAEHHGTYGTSEYPTFRAKDNLEVRYLEYAFHDPRFLHEARALCRGTTGRARLNPEDFLKLKMRLPDKEEQTKIVGVLGTAQQELDQAQKYLLALKDQKRGLMQRLLTGHVRVQVDAEEHTAK